MKGTPPTPPDSVAESSNQLPAEPCQKLYYEKINPYLPEICGIVRLLLSLCPYFLLKNGKDRCNDNSELLLAPTVNDSLLVTSCMEF